MDEFIPVNLFGNTDNENDTETKEDTSSADMPTEEVTEVKAAESQLTEAPSETVTEEATEEATEEGTEEITDEDTEEATKVAAEESGEEVTAEATVKAAEEVDETGSNEKAEEQNAKLDKLLESQQQLLKGLESLDALFKARIMHTDYEEKIVDQMHKELQKYKEDMYAQLIRPVLLDVIEVRDSIMRMAATYLAKPEGEQAIPNKTFSDYAYDLQDILEKNSVEIYRSKPGDDYTPLRQRVIKKVATADEALHGKVAESLSCGYGYNGRTISAEKITVYYYEKPNEENENSEVIENG